MPTTSEQVAALIDRYKATGDKNIRNEIVLACGNLIRYAAISTRSIYQKFFETEDIVNEAALSLMAAIDTFDESHGAKFETYASLKMRGAIIDYVRSQDSIPRSVRLFSKELGKAFSALYASLGREPSSEEIAGYMGLSKEKLQKSMADTVAMTSLSFEELLYEGNFDISDSEEGGGWATERTLQQQELQTLLGQAIENLKEQQRLVVSLYYYERLKFSEIGKVLGVSESRICQIHSKAMLNLKYSLENYINN